MQTPLLGVRLAGRKPLQSLSGWSEWQAFSRFAGQGLQKVMEQVLTKNCDGLKILYQNSLYFPQVFEDSLYMFQVTYISC